MPPGIPIFTFHALDHGREPFAFPPARFAELLDRLAAAGFAGRPIGELVDAVEAGSPPARRCGLTFDDGYRSLHEHALPLLAARGMPATVFVNGPADPGAERERLAPMLGRERLSWAEMREMGRHGIEFGAHTVTHPDLTRLDEAEIERQLVDSKRRLEDALSLPVRTFAYPYGRFDVRSRDAARRHFEAAFSDRLGLLRPGDDRWALPRVETYYLRSTSTLPLVASAGLAAYLALRNVPRRLRRLRRQG
jgi:peptidoglycan/xylan/chitin deacetylase (PgdA/CDA1 family)